MHTHTKLTLPVNSHDNVTYDNLPTCADNWMFDRKIISDTERVTSKPK